MSACGRGVVNGPAAVANASHPPMTQDGGRGVPPFGTGRQAHPPAEDRDKPRRLTAAAASTSAHQCGCAACSHQAAHPAPKATIERREFGPVTPGVPEQDHGSGFGELVVAGDDHHGLHAAAAYPAGLAAHAARAVHHRRPRVPGVVQPARPQFVAQVPQGVAFAVVVRAERGPDGGDEVGAVEADLPDLGALPDDLSG